MRVGWRLMTGAALLLVLLSCSLAGPVGAARAEEYGGLSSEATTEVATIEGRLVALASSARFDPGRPNEAPAVSLLVETRDARVSVTLAAGARVLSAGGEPVEVTRLSLGGNLKLEGRWLSATQFEASSVAAQP